MTLVRHDTDLFSVEHEFGWQAGMITIPVRMTVFRLDDGRLVLHSPVPISAGLREELDSLGPVGFIVVPRAHGRFVAEAVSVFPHAQLLPATKPPARRRGALPWQPSLAESPPAAWAGQLETFLVRGFRLDEVLLFQPSSRTLVITDLCFNIQRSSSQRSRIFLKANGMWKHFGPSRLIRRIAVSNRAALRESLEEMMKAWSFDRIVPGHGDVIEHGGPAALRAAWIGSE